MVLHTTYKNDDHTETINNLVGKPFGLIRSFKIGGIGSGRMIVDQVSENMTHVLNFTAKINYANIELRPSGILIHITKGHQLYTWIIPFYQLVIFKSDGLSIYANGAFIKFQNSIHLKENKHFLDKMLKMKSDFQNRFNFQD